MKIVIQFTSSYKADISIDGRKLTVDRKPGVMELNGVTPDEQENTLGGMVASALFAKVGDIMQGWAAAQDEQPNVATWDVLADRAADAAYHGIGL